MSRTEGVLDRSGGSPVEVAKEIQTVRIPSIPSRALATMTAGALAAGAVAGAGAVVLLRGPNSDANALDPSPSSSQTAAPTASPVGSDELAAAHAYLDIVRPIAQEAGRMVQDGMKPAVTQLADPDDDHAALSQQASGWVGGLASAQLAWSATPPPPALHDAHLLFLDALATYREVADRLASATTDEERRAELVAEAIDLGTRADELYDQAAQLVQTHLMAGGEDPAAWLPQPDDA